MHLTFDPPLASETSLRLLHRDAERNQGDAAEAVSLELYTTLSSEDFRLLNDQHAVIQVWSDIPYSGRGAGEWGSTPFQLAQSKQPPSSAQKAGDSSPEVFLASPPPAPHTNGVAHDDSASVTLTASFPLPPTLLASHADLLYRFTYRIEYPDGGVWWQGGEQGNGTILLTPSLDPLQELTKLSWDSEPDGTRSYTLPKPPLEGSKLETEVIIDLQGGYSATWSGWAICENGPVAFSIDDPPPESSFIFLIATQARKNYTSIKNFEESFILHTDATWRLSMDSGGSTKVKCVFSAAPDGSLPPLRQPAKVYLRKLSPQLISVLFGLISMKAVDEHSWTVLKQEADASASFVALMSPPSPLVRRVSILPLTGVQGQTATVAFERRVLSSAVGGSGIAYCPETSSIADVDPDGPVLKVQVSPSGGSLILSPMISIPSTTNPSSCSVAATQTLVDVLSPRTQANGDVQADKHSGETDDPELMDPQSYNQDTSAFPSTNGDVVDTSVAKSANPVMASAMYLALLITVILAYISPAAYRSPAPAPAPSLIDDGDDKSQREYAIKHRTEAALSTKDLQFVSSRATDHLSLFIRCSADELSDLIFSVGDEEVDFQAKEMAVNLWLTTIPAPSRKNTVLRISTRSH